MGSCGHSLLSSAAAFALAAACSLPVSVHAQALRPPASPVRQQLGASALNDEVVSATEASDGYLYAVGKFTAAGGAAANKIARCDKSQQSISSTGWSAAGSGPAGGAAASMLLARRSHLRWCRSGPAASSTSQSASSASTASPHPM